MMLRKLSIILSLAIIALGLISGCAEGAVSPAKSLPNGLYGCPWGTSFKDCQDILRKNGISFKLDENKLRKIFVCEQGGCKDENKMLWFDDEDRLFYVLFVDYWPSGYSLDYLLKTFGNPKDRKFGPPQTTYKWEDGVTSIYLSISKSKYQISPANTILIFKAIDPTKKEKPIDKIGFFIHEYDLARLSGVAKDAFSKAAFVTMVYLGAKDRTNYLKWKKITDTCAKAAGISNYTLNPNQMP